MISRKSRVPICCFALLVGTLAARAQSVPAAKETSPHSLGESATLAAAHQLCSIVREGRVVCIDGWLQDYSERTRPRRLIRKSDRTYAYEAPTTSMRSGSAVWQEVAGLRDVVSLTAGSQFLCALTRQGAVKCWGYDFPDANLPEGTPPSRLFGDGPENYVPQPTPLRGVRKKVIAVTAQYENVYLRLADGTFQHLNDPFLKKASSTGCTQKIRRISALIGDDRYLCYLDSRGCVHCQRDYDDPCLDSTVVSGFAEPMTQIGLTCTIGECSPRLAGLSRRGQLHFCRLPYGTKECWQATDLQPSVVELVRGCARTSVGEVYCWGWGFGFRGSPERISLPEPAVELAAKGGRVQCARLASGKIACFVPEGNRGKLLGPPEVLDAPRIE